MICISHLLARLYWSLPQLKSKRSSPTLFPWISLALLTAGCGYMMLQTLFSMGNVAGWHVSLHLAGHNSSFRTARDTIHSSAITTPGGATFIRALASVYIYPGMAKLSSDWLVGPDQRPGETVDRPTAPTMLKDMVLRGVGRNGMNTLLTWGGMQPTSRRR